jgi:hypothetical protein
MAAHIVAPPRYDLHTSFQDLYQRLALLEQAVYNPTFPIAQLYRTGAQGINPLVDAQLSWSGDRGSAIEPFWFGSAPNALFIPPARTGWWLITLTAQWSHSSNFTSPRLLTSVFKNGNFTATGVIMRDEINHQSSAQHAFSLAKIVKLNAGDYLTAHGFHMAATAISLGGANEWEASFGAAFLRGLE